MGGHAAWLPRWWRWHAWGASALTLGVAAAARGGWAVPPAAEVAGLAAAVALFGVPHGALDPWVARRAFEPRLGPGWRPWFGAGYLGVAGLVVAAWAAAPPLALGGFLLLSAWHFGEGDAEPVGVPRRLGWAERLARGAMPIVLPAAAFPEEVARLFGWVMGGAADAGAAEARLAGGLAWTAPRVLAPALALVAASHLVRLTRGRGRRPAAAGVRPPAPAAAHPQAAHPQAAHPQAAHLQAAVEIGALAALFAAVPPLPAFVVYFCGWHAARHTLHLAAELDARRPARALGRFARLALPATVATAVGGAAAWLALRPAAGDLPAAVRAVFVGLSALTVPHMLVNAAAARRSAHRPAAPRRAASEPGRRVPAGGAAVAGGR